MDASPQQKVTVKEMSILHYFMSTKSRQIFYLDVLLETACKLIACIELR